MRYTEARLKKIAEEMLADINKETVDFQLNFDDTLEEPTVLPSRIPNLLVNGASGIAVGMATNMPPHNLTEVVNATIAYIENNDVTVADLMQHVKAPDFPTGGIIYGYTGVQEAFETGRGRIVMRAKAEIELHKGDRERIIVNEIPLLLEKGMQPLFDFLVIVISSEKNRLARLINGGFTKEQVLARMSKQVDDETRRASADFLIVNDGILDQLEVDVEKIWQTLQERKFQS
jgi:hypothetical protein